MGWRDRILEEAQETEEKKKPSAEKKLGWRDRIVEDDSVLGSAYRGAVTGLSSSFIDEIAGALEAGGSAIGLRGLGGDDLRDIRLETDEEDKQSKAAIYRAARDAKRAVYAKAERDNPAAFLGGDVVGSIVQGVAVPGSTSVKAAAAYGAGQGLGRSEADLTTGDPEEYANAALDTAGGAALGAGGALALKGGAKLVRGGASTIAHATVPYGKAIVRGAKSGSRDAAEAAPPMFGIKEAAGIWGGVKGALREVGDQRAVNKEVGEMAEVARDHLAGIVRSGPEEHLVRNRRSIVGVGRGKPLSKFTDDEAITAALLTEGDNPVKRWTAEKAAAIYPGQIDSDEYVKLLNMGPEARTVAREFDKKGAGKELQSLISDFQDIFVKTRNSRTKELNEAAKSTFDSDGAASVLEFVDDAIYDSNSMRSVPGQINSLLEDVKGILDGSVNTKNLNLAPGKWDEITAGDKFDRLQKSRQLIDRQINWTQQQGLGEAEYILRNTRKAIDEALKTSPEKVEADALFRASKEVEGKFFGATQFRDASGNVEVDEFKLAKLLNDTDAAGRFKNSLEDLRKFAAREDLPKVMRDRAIALIDEIEAKIAKAGQQRDLSAFRYKNGPSSPAIERMTAITKGPGGVKDAVQNPAGWMFSADQFNKQVKARTGKTLNELAPAERSGVLKFYSWMQKNPEANAAKRDEMWQRLVPAK